MMWRLLACIILLGPVGAFAGTTYYVAPTGNDTTGTGSSGNPWRNPQKCVGVVGPGDTCILKDGTYTDIDGDGIILYISASSRGALSGTSGNPITFRAENLHGAKLRVPAATTTGGYGVRVTVPYHIIEGFEITDDGIPTTQGASSAITGISFGETSAPVGVAVRRNHIHDIARNVCSNSTIGNTAINGNPGAGSVIEYNLIHTIGRKRNGEAGCSTTIYQLDHGMYVWNMSGVTIRNNVFYDNSRGYDITLYKVGGQTTTGLNIYNNTFVKPTLTDPQPFGCINFSQNNSNINVKNNIFYNCEYGYAVFWALLGTTSNVTIAYNLTDSADADMQNPGGKPASGVTDSNNIVGSNFIGFTSSGTSDYTLTGGSDAIGAGVDVGYPYNWSAPTIGAFDPPTFSSCEVPLSAGTKIRVAFVNHSPPLLPATGATLFTARKNAVANPLTGSVSRISDNVMEMTVTNAYANGDSVDISGSVWNITGSDLIGGVKNQKFVGVLSNLICSNNVGGAPTLRYSGGVGF